jgi:hypothetical protein
MEQRNIHAAPNDYRAIIIAECVRLRLRGRGTHPSVTAKSTALNAADSGRGGVSAHRGEIKAREGGLLGLTWPFAFISLAFFASPAP